MYITFSSQVEHRCRHYHDVKITNEPRYEAYINAHDSIHHSTTSKTHAAESSANPYPHANKA